MGFKSDIENAQEAKPLDIREIGKKLGLTEDDLELYGKYKAKVDYNLLKKDNRFIVYINDSLKTLKESVNEINSLDIEVILYNP